MVSGASSASEATTTSAAVRRSAGLVVVTAIHFMPARRAACTPGIASSITTQRSGGMSIARAAVRKTSGAGLPGISVPEIRASSQAPRSNASTKKSMLSGGADEAMAWRTPASCREASQVLTPGRGLISSRINSRKYCSLPTSITSISAAVGARPNNIVRIPMLFMPKEARNCSWLNTTPAAASTCVQAR